MIWLLTRLVVWPVKGLELGFKTGRLVGYRRIIVFLLGVAVGAMLTPYTGAELRAHIRKLIDGDLTNDPVPAESPVGREYVDLPVEGAR
jgi:hypothetical protein